MKEKNKESLSIWLKLAGRVDSVRGFEQKMGFSGLDKDDNIRI